MHAGALRALEYDRIVEAVRRFAQTPPGATRLAKLQPLIDARAVASALAATAETVRFLRDGEIALRLRSDLDAMLGSLAVEGRVLEPLQLVNLATFLASVDATCAGVRRVRSSFPILAAIAEPVASFEREIADIRRKIGPADEVLDDASPELASLRDRLRKQRARLRGTLESYLRGKDTSKYLQQQIVTDRNGRYVLVVRSRAPRRDSGNRARQLGQRRQPLPRAPQHRRDQQRHRRARAAGKRRSAAHPARAGRCAALARRRSPADGRRRDRTRRAAGVGPGSRCWWTASSRRSPATAGSSCARRATRCSFRRCSGIWARTEIGLGVERSSDDAW